MRLCSIASGSSGNCIYVGSEQTHVLVDAGISGKRIEEGLKKAEITGKDLSAIFITHEHSDHIQGIGVLARKYGVPMYATRGTIDGIVNGAKNLGEYDKELFHPICVDEDVQVGDLMVHPFRISHDAKEPCAYRFESEGSKAAVATDMGTFSPYIVENLKGLNAILLEANHDIRMLQAGPYTYALKQRILSDRGHLSNMQTSKYLKKVIGPKTKNIMFIHLSEKINKPELVIETFNKSNEFNNENITISKQNEVSKVIEV